MNYIDRMNTLSAVIGADLKNIKNDIGNKEVLLTEEKNTLVDAINSMASVNNEAKKFIAAKDIKYASPELVDTKISYNINQLIDGAPETYNTFKEVAEYISQDKDNAAQMIKDINGAVRFDKKQKLTEDQQNQAADNIGLSDINLVELYTNILNAED